jgi:hypothetical protein
MNRKIRVVADGPRGIHKLTKYRMEGQAKFPLKALKGKTASRCLILLRNERKFN